MKASTLVVALSLCVVTGGRIGTLPGVKGGDHHFAGLLTVPSPWGNLSTFYYYVPHADPTKPLLIWMNGGPGASSLNGLFSELGPHLLNLNGAPTNLSNTSGWSAFDNPSSWSSEASLLVWEQPSGVGFSRCLGGCPAVWNDTSSAEANVAILRAFYAMHPEARTRGLFISGESYAGIYVPLLAQQVLHSSDLPQLRGAAVGNGCVGYGVSGGCGLDALDVFVSTIERKAPGVDRQLLATARAACPGELNRGLLPSQLSASCKAAMEALIRDLGDYNFYHWASPCGPEGQGNWGDGSAFACGNGVLEAYLALPETQRALNVIGAGEPPLTWQQWDGDSQFYNITTADALPAYRELLEHNVSVLIYNGLADTGVPFVGAEKWVPLVAGPKIARARRKWGSGFGGTGFAGWVITYGSGLTLATIAGAGHMVPGDRPVQAQSMLTSWLGGVELPEYKGAACKRLWLGRGWGDFCGSAHGNARGAFTNE